MVPHERTTGLKTHVEPAIWFAGDECDTHGAFGVLVRSLNQTASGRLFVGPLVHPVNRLLRHQVAQPGPPRGPIPWTDCTDFRRPIVPHVATSPSDLLDALSAVAHLDGDRLVIDDERAFRDTGIRDLAWTAAFTDDEATAAAAQWLVWEASQELGARSASIQELYAARGRGEVSGFTVPAINIRAQTFDLARTVFEAAEGRTSGRSSSSWRAASRRTPTNARSTTRRRSSPAPSPRTGGASLHPGRPLTSSTPRSTPPILRP